MKQGQLITFALPTRPLVILFQERGWCYSMSQLSWNLKVILKRRGGGCVARISSFKARTRKLTDLGLFGLPEQKTEKIRWQSRKLFDHNGDFQTTFFALGVPFWNWETCDESGFYVVRQTRKNSLAKELATGSRKCPIEDWAQMSTQRDKYRPPP